MPEVTLKESGELELRILHLEDMLCYYACQLLSYFAVVLLNYFLNLLLSNIGFLHLRSLNKVKHVRAEEQHQGHQHMLFLILVFRF